MSERGIVATCRACAREQRIFTPDMARAEAEDFSGLLDGSHPLFVKPSPPGDGPPWGRCGVCGGRFDAALFGYEGQ